MKIKTAYETLNDAWYSSVLDADWRDVAETAVKEYAAQFIDLAAEQATTELCPLLDKLVVNENSILNLKKQIK